MSIVVRKEKVKKMPRKEEEAEFRCMECGYRFWDVDNAERAQRHGCPGCNGTDIDLA